MVTTKERGSSEGAHPSVADRLGAHAHGLVAEGPPPQPPTTRSQRG